jgi:hypothetical protein
VRSAADPNCLIDQPTPATPRSPFFETITTAQARGQA